MATLLTNQTEQDYHPNVISPGGGTVNINTSEYFFYSNSPETLDTSDMADNGKFLNRVYVNGHGQIYTWHRNSTGTTIKNCILIYNTNSYAVKINVTNYGITNTSNQSLPDAAAWENYYNGQNTSLTVPAGGFSNLFFLTVPNGNDFGVVARANIVKNGTTTPAGVTMFDLTYINSGNNAYAFATADPPISLRSRGLGSGFYSTITFPTTSPSLGGALGYKIACSTSFFFGAECSVINDVSGATSGLLEGAFGQQLDITIPIKNTTGSTRKFRIFIGSHGGSSFPFVNHAGGIAKYLTGISANNYVDVIESGNIANGATSSIQFSTVVTAKASTPYVIGVRAL